MASLTSEQFGEKHQRQTGAIVGSVRLHFPFRIKSQLSTREEILSPQRLIDRKPWPR